MKEIQNQAKAALPERCFYVVRIGDERQQTLRSEREVASAINHALHALKNVEITIKKVTV